MNVSFSSPPLLVVQGLQKKFAQRQVLKQLALTVHHGEVVVILGSSGCGKSTFLRCLNGLEAIDSGSIQFNGQELNHPSTHWPTIRQKIGMVFQSYELFPHLTVLENILLGPLKVQKRAKEEVQQQAETLLERVGLLDRQHAYPRQLSGGQKQRIAIVRALCMQPELMLFDEVTASLDPEMVREVLDVILDLAKGGMTMLIVTHELNFARRVADRILFFEQGGILEESSNIEQFFTRPKTERVKQFLTTYNY